MKATFLLSPRHSFILCWNHVQPAPLFVLPIPNVIQIWLLFPTKYDDHIHHDSKFGIYFQWNWKWRSPYHYWMNVNGYNSRIQSCSFFRNHEHDSVKLVLAITYDVFGCFCPSSLPTTWCLWIPIQGGPRLSRGHTDDILKCMYLQDNHNKLKKNNNYINIKKNQNKLTNK